MHDTKAPATRFRMVQNAKWIEEPADDATGDPVPEMKTARKVEDDGGKCEPTPRLEDQLSWGAASSQR
jgi:hypothetical protein